MKHFLVVFVMLVIYGSMFSQKVDYSQEWLNQLENPPFESWQLKLDNDIDTYINYDFAALMIPRTEFLGYISSDYRKILVYFSSVTKDPINEKLYHIKGASVVLENKCDFEGTIEVTQIREYENMHWGLDKETNEEGYKAQGILIGNYHFKENPEQKHVGEFTGVMTVYWYIDRYGLLQYDNIESFYSDNYKNNQYIGTWKGYQGEKERTCNWGEHRIPFSGDLDVGAAEFIANPKYKKMGW
jgi:hypothetical protein